MAKPRKNAPALYELIGGRSRVSPPGSHVPQEYEEEHGGAEIEEEVYEEEPHRSILSPGRTVRMPVGYFFFALAIVIATAIGAYILGFQMRDAAYQRQEKRRAQLEAPVEPLDQPVNRSLLGPSPVGASGSQPSRPGSPAKPPSPEIGSGPGKVVVVGAGTSDPREKGVNYAIVATLGKERATDLAAFLSERGVDVAVVPTNNARLFFVVTLKGFPSGTYRTEERENYEALLKALGKEWERLGGGRRDFGGLWWDKYDG